MESELTTQPGNVYGAPFTRGEDVAKREPQVHGELGMLSDAVQQLATVTEALEGRLRCVSHPEADGQALGRAMDAEPLVPTAERLRELRYGVEAHTMRLRGVLDRLEV